MSLQLHDNINNNNNNNNNNDDNTDNDTTIDTINNNTLHSHIHCEEDLSWELRKTILLGVARGVHHLHSESIIHRDLAARNILLTANMESKVADFGLSRQLLNKEGNNYTKSSFGPLKWMAPEAILHKKYSPASDAFSFGVVRYIDIDID